MPISATRDLATWAAGMMILWSLLASGCATVFLQEDGFSDRMRSHCKDRVSCTNLRMEAHARLRDCQHNTVGHVRCQDARADEAWLVDQVSHYDAEEQVARERARQAQLREEAELRERQRRADAEEQVRQEEEAVLDAIRKADAQEREDWRKASVETCKQAASLDACAPLKRYLAQYEPAGSPHVAEGRAVLLASEPALTALADEGTWSHLPLADCKRPKTALSCQSVLAYTQTFPSGKHADEARQVLAGSERAIAQLAAAEERKLLREQQQADQRSAAQDHALREAEAARQAAIVRQMVADAATAGQAYYEDHTVPSPSPSPPGGHHASSDHSPPTGRSSPKSSPPARPRSWFSGPAPRTRSWFGRPAPTQRSWFGGRSNTRGPSDSQSRSSSRGRGK